MDNTARGILAEFLVAAALGRHKTPRVEWERYDLRTPSGVTIEVKSAGAIQSWKQKARTPNSEQARRWADLYVFCVLEGTDPLDVDKWQFWVLPRSVLDRSFRADRV